MSLETITLNPINDAFLNQSSPTLNYGATTTSIVGSTGAGARRNAIQRFDIPNYVGVVKSIKIRVYVTVIGGQQTIGVHLMDSPYDDLWIEGVSNGGVDLNGCSWDEYLKNANWPTGGGDFAAEPIGMKVFQAADPTGQYYDIEIPIDNFTPSALKKQSFVLVCPDDTVSNLITFQSREGANQPELVVEVEIDGFDAPILSAEPISSTQLDISWDKSELSDDNFTHYLLEQSDTGVGGWTTLATITDKDTVKHKHTGVVVQGDVDDYDEDSDTYPSGRTKYYRLSVVSDVFGATGYGTADATTIPAIRPVSLSFSPKSKYWDEDFIDDNIAFKPYGVEVIPSWYDILDITEENYIDKLTIESYFRSASTWPGAASETDDFSPVNFDVGGIIEGDTGYKPYKIKGKIYDTGGLYRKATTDKTNEQFDVAWPAPCPVAIPDGAYADAPPALLGRPFSAGQLVPIDLSIAGQQIGAKIFEEDFLGNPNDAGKWNLSGNSFVTTYGAGVGSAPIMSTNFNAIGPTTLFGYKKLRGQDPDNEYNRYFSKYTGAYRCRYVFRFDSAWNFGVTTTFKLHFAAWDSTLGNRGYHVAFSESAQSMILSRHGNFVSDTLVLLSTNLGSDAPILATNREKFFLVDIIMSPYWSGANPGYNITLIYNIDTTLAGVLNINYDTHAWLYNLNDIGHNVLDKAHYTGRTAIQLSSSNQTNAKLDMYECNVIGRVSGEYGLKNLTHDQILGLVNSPIPTFPITASPDQTSELCYIEGRIKNEYGSQSRTGEVDDYQGDTFNNAIPIGFLAVPKTGFVGSDVLIDASQSIDPEGGSLIYKYDFGDTETLETSQSSVSHQYAATGTYTVKLIVEDEAGLLSVEVQAIITIYDALEQFEEVSLMSPWESINEGSPSGTSSTSHPELDYDTIQTMEGGNRVFGLTGQHHDPDCNTPLADRITNAENEKDYFHVLYNQAKLITLDLVNFGKVRGVITDHKPSMAVDDQQAFQFSMTFQEIDVRQFE